ncbi:MAG: hypothetical protein HY266_07475 [Deltaproteobacteria bacterium]|nr:hypothetical protein [Deltaproteobacteria bacterium]
MNKIRCYSCARDLQEGSLKYVVEIKSYADFDGFLEDYPGDVELGMVELLKELEDTDQKTLEDDVYQEMVLILCKACRDKFYKGLLDTAVPISVDRELKDTIH